MAYSMAKAKRKAIPKHTEDTLDNKRRMYLDIQTFKAKPNEAPYSKLHMCMCVVAPMQLKFASFHQTKNGMMSTVA